MPFAFVSHCIISDQTKKRDKKEKDQKSIVTTSRSFDLRVYKKKIHSKFFTDETINETKNKRERNR